MSTPAAAVTRFYRAIGARDLEAAWEFLSPRFQGTIAYEKWLEGYATTRGAEVTSATTSSQTNSSAAVEVTVVSIDVIEGRRVSKTFQGSWTLVSVGGQWRLDRPSIRQVG